MIRRVSFRTILLTVLISLLIVIALFRVIAISNKKEVHIGGGVADFHTGKIYSPDDMINLNKKRGVEE